MKPLLPAIAPLFLLPSASAQDQGDTLLYWLELAPDTLEPRPGEHQSKGCIRIPASLKDFIDRHTLYGR